MINVQRQADVNPCGQRVHDTSPRTHVRQLEHGRDALFRSEFAQPRSPLLIGLVR